MVIYLFQGKRWLWQDDTLIGHQGWNRYYFPHMMQNTNFSAYRYKYHPSGRSTENFPNPSGDFFSKVIRPQPQPYNLGLHECTAVVQTNSPMSYEWLTIPCDLKVNSPIICHVKADTGHSMKDHHKTNISQMITSLRVVENSILKETMSYKKSQGLGV